MTSLTIKDIAHTEELSALSAVRGGSNYNFGNLNAAYGGGNPRPLRPGGLFSRAFGRYVLFYNQSPVS
ncbi:hypothetical protein BZM26_31530 [Paraburkholderia strydomiana]|nr:hypothetical protein BZM26_31530 [Paraburkholderia strydomiana]